MANIIASPFCDARTALVSGGSGSWYPVPDALYAGKSWTRDTSNTYPADGSHSMKYTHALGATGEIYLSIPITGVGAGGQYQFSYWCKTDNLAATGTYAGARAVVEGYIGSSQITTLATSVDDITRKGMLGTNGWTEKVLTTKFLPPVTSLGETFTHLRMRLYVSGSTSGTAHFDNFSLQLLDSTKFDTMVLNPEGRVTYPDSLRMGAVVWGNPLHATSGMTMSAVLTSPEGVTSTVSLTGVVEGRNELHEMTMGSLGTYTCVMNLFDTSVSTTVPIETRTHSIVHRSWTTTPPTVTNKQVFKNNQPQFVIGGVDFASATQANRSAYLTGFADVGLNTWLYFSVPQIATYTLIDDFLNKCQEASINLVFGMKNCYDTVTVPLTGQSYDGETTLTSGQEIMEAMVDRYKDHPAVMAWFLEDEGDNATHFTAVQEIYDYIKANDSKNPCYSIQSAYRWEPRMDHDSIALTRNMTDIAGVDIYPLVDGRNWNINTVSEGCDIALDGTQNARPLWVVIDSPIISTASISTPTSGKLLCEACQCITKGACGIFFYPWSYMLGANGVGGETQADRIAILKATVSQLRKLTPFVVAQDATSQAACTGTVQLLTKDIDGELFTLAVNTSGSCTTLITIPDDSTVVMAGIPSNPGVSEIEVSDNSFSYEFGDYEATVFRHGTSAARATSQVNSIRHIPTKPSVLGS